MVDFLLIGAQRSGSTSFFNSLIQHPGILAPTRKEIHFFDLHFDKGIKWYLEQFPSIDKEDKTKVILGEATPYYLFHPLVPKRVFENFPNVKLIVLLRNPIDRAFSHYNHALRSGNIKIPFDEAIMQELLTLSKEETKVVEGEFSPVHQRLSFIERGIYVEQLKRWFEFFAKNQFIFLKSEEYFSNPQAILNEVFKFLGIPECDVINLENCSPPYPKISQHIREKLEKFYAPYNQSLYQLLGRDLGW